MDKEILEHYSSNSAEALQAFLNKQRTDQLTSVLDQYTLRGKGDPVLLLRAILSGSPVTGSEGIQRRYAVFRHVVTMLSTQDLSSKTSAEFLGVLLMETDTLSTSSLTGLVDIYIDAIKTGIIASGKALELFPKILATVASKEEVTMGDGQMKGPEYKSHVLNNICSSRWDSTTVIHLASMFKDVQLSTEEMSFVISKILRMMKEMDIQELPPLVYQLMLLANKGPKKAILDGIISFFVEKDLELKGSNNQNEVDSLNEESTSAEELHHIEGTVILHISFAMKQDQELARQFIKYYKDIYQFSLGKALAPFTVAVALSTSDLMGFGDQVFELLKTTIYRSFKNEERCRESNWVNEMNQGGVTCADIVLDTVKNSVVGWDHILQGLVRLGFILMESYGPKACFGRVVDVASAVGGRLSPAQRSCQLGAQILQESFKVHDVVRASVIEQLINHIVTNASSPVSQYIGLLTGLVKSCPQVLLSSVTRLKEAFDYLTYLPLATCESLLVAIQPLLRISINLRDSLVLVLRKAMFSRQLESRRVAASSFLMLISNFKLLGNLSASQMSFSSQCSSFGSQIQMDVHSQRNRTMNESVCLEILGSLRRCLSQQADVRLILYEGLLNVSKSNPQLAVPIFAQLKAQFLKYYDPDVDGIPPVKLDPCIAVQGEDIVTAEPLAHLLSALIHCYLSRRTSRDDDVDDDDASYDEVRDVLNSLVLRMIKCEPEDFELDKSADYSTETSVGVRNTILVLLVCGMYETLMEYAFQSTDFRATGCEQMMKLFQNFKRLSDILKEKPTAGAAAPKKGHSKVKEGASTSSNTAAVTKNCGLLSLGFLSSILTALYNDDVPAHQEALTLLRADVGMQKYFLSATNEKLSQFQQIGRCDGSDGRNGDKVFNFCANIAKVLLKHYTACLQSAGAEDRPLKNRSVVSLCLETFSVSVNVATTRYHKKLGQFLQALASSSTSEKESLGVEELLCKQIRKFQRMVITVLTSNDEERSLKDVATLLNIIFTLTQCVNSDSKQLSEVQQWVLSLCKEQSLDDIPIAKMLIGQLFSLSRQVCEALPIVHIMAQDVHALLGDIDQEVEVSDEKTFVILNHRVAAAVVILLLHHIDKEVDDTEIVVNKLKATTSSAPRVTDTQEENSDRSICVRLVHVINVFHELLQTVIPTGPAVENLLKTLHRLYAVLTNLVKWKLSLYASNSGHISSRFEKLIKLTGNSLTQFVYSTITYIQVSQTEQLQLISEKGKKKNGGKKTTSQPGKALILKETRSIPNLIYAIEQYEKFLIQLAKKSKIDLMSHFKMSTSRDFRINVAALQEALQSDSEPEDEEEADDEEREKNEGNEEESHPAKKIKTESSVAASSKPATKALVNSSKNNTNQPSASNKGKKRLGKK